MPLPLLWLRAHGVVDVRAGQRFRPAGVTGVPPSGTTRRWRTRPSPPTALDVIVELLATLDGIPTPPTASRPPLRGARRQASMRRAGLLLYDDARKLVVPMGSRLSTPACSGRCTDRSRRPDRPGRAGRGSRGGGLRRAERWLPPRYAWLSHPSTITRTPVSAGGWLGVIRRPRRRDLHADRRRAPRDVDARQDRGVSRERRDRDQPAGARLLQTQSILREIHERVMQRLFGVSLVLGSARAERAGAPALRRGDVAALSDLRDAPAVGAAEHRHRRDFARGARSARAPLQGPEGCSTSTGCRASRCRRRSRDWRSRCWPRPCATPTSMPRRPVSASAWRAAMNPAPEVRNDGARRESRGNRHGPASRRDRGSGAGAASWSSGPRTAPSGAFGWSFRCARRPCREPRAQPARARGRRP